MVKLSFHSNEFRDAKGKPIDYGTFIKLEKYCALKEGEITARARGWRE
jgi:hypothetical protein